MCVANLVIKNWVPNIDPLLIFDEIIQIQNKKLIIIQKLKMSHSEAQILNEKVLPKVNDIHQLIRNFHGQQISQFEQMIRNIEGVEDELRDKQEECQNYINQIKNKRKDQDKMGQISKGVLQAKSEQIKSKVKNIDAVSAGIKETVGKIKPDKLLKLPVNEDRNLKKLFETIYATVYSQNTGKQFQWNEFKNLALKHQDGEDFISRLVNVNFKDLSNDKYDRLLELKNDPQFQNMSVKSKYSHDIIDLADWVDYTCLGHQFNEEKKRSEKDYDKIRKDIDKKAKGSLQVSQNFWKEASSEIQGYQTQIQSINSELKTIVFGLKRSVEDFNQIGSKTTERINQISRLH